MQVTLLSVASRYQHLQSLPFYRQLGLQPLAANPYKLFFCVQIESKPLSIVSNLCIQLRASKTFSSQHTGVGVKCLIAADLLLKAHNLGRCLPAKGYFCPASEPYAGLWRLATDAVASVLKRPDRSASIPYLRRHHAATRLAEACNFLFFSRFVGRRRQVPIPIGDLQSSSGLDGRMQPSEMRVELNISRWCRKAVRSMIVSGGMQAMIMNECH